MRRRLVDAPIRIPSTGWRWTSSNSISLGPVNTSFEQSTIYELVYIGKDPVVAGIGFLATRDFVSFLRSDRTDNPLVGEITRVMSWSQSQPARYMNDFIWLGFNEDLSSKRVFDGVFNWIGAGSGVGLNYRFAQPQRTERNRQNHLYPEASFPFAYNILTDHRTGKIDGRNAQCEKTRTCPKIMNVNSASEYWTKTGSLLHSDLAGRDLPDPPNVRHYLIAGTQHARPARSNSRGICQQFVNTIEPIPALRALFVALDQWLDSREPPASAIPRSSDGTVVFSRTTRDSPLGIGIVLQSSLPWPTIPNVLYTGVVTVRNRSDSSGTYYPSFVSKVDGDGNELAGIRLPPVSVPVGTHTGWNLRRVEYGGDDGCEEFGSIIPFAPNESVRRATGDTRLSLTERYGNHRGYVTAIASAVETLARQRFLLVEDALGYVNAARRPTEVTNNPTYGNYSWL